MSEPTWHALSAQATLEQLQSHAEQGLTTHEAARRLSQHGPNRLAQASQRSAWRRLLGQFHNVLLYVMMASAVITAFLGYWIDTAVLMAAVVVNAIIGFIQEGKAESAMDAIRAMLSPHATVLRDGQRHDVEATELVPGDVVMLCSGDRVPADVRIVDSRELRVDESALTGESLPVEKGAEACAVDTAMGDRSAMAYAGTVVVFGQARAVVVATGQHTELGRIDAMLGHIQGMSTPLLRQIDHFGRKLAAAILLLAGITFVLGVWGRGQAPADMFMMVVALVASAIPEGLPAIMTVTLALGVQRMARRQAIVRRLPAVETLGSVTVICSDKTGTLTRNEMTVQRVVCADHVFNVGGVGYAPVGDFSLDDRIVAPAEHRALAHTLLAGVLCNDARLREVSGAWHIEGDPTEGALLVMAAKAGMDAHDLNSFWPRVDAIPFESEHRFMATAHRDAQGEDWVFVKGAPERVLDMCSHEMGHDGTPAPLRIDHWRRMATDTAAQGLRVLALACKHGPEAAQALTVDGVGQGLTMLALVGIIDPPRQEAVAAVADCHAAGIRVKMITGDHAETARAIGAQLAIGTGKPALTGAEIGLLSDAELQRVVADVDVFARASPEHKLRLVRALQANGEVVAMTGDGVNDAPALKRADIGVAMGGKGTEAAKEAAGIVLADDNFATIARAVREGRAVYDNIKKFILFMLPTNGGEALVVMAAMLGGFLLPMTPVQILWINMVTSSTLGLALAFEPAEDGLMRRPPRAPSEPLLSGLFVWRLVMVSFLMMAASLGLFLWEMAQGADVATARTMAVNAVVICEMFYLINSRYIIRSVLSWKGLTGNPYVLLAIGACILLQLAYTHTAVLHQVFGSTHLAWLEWVKVLAVGGVFFGLAELEKWLMRQSRWAAKGMAYA